MFITSLTIANTDLSQKEFQQLPVEVQQQILEVKSKGPTTVENVGEWVGLGKEVGVAVNEALGAVTKTASEFGETKLGKLTIVLVIWKVVGEDIIQLGFAFIWIFLVTFLAFFVYYKYGKTKRHLIKETYNEETKKYDKEWRIIEPEDIYMNASWIILIIGYIISIPIFIG
jgi:hypothetical protein